MTTLYPTNIDNKVNPTPAGLTSGPTDSTYGNGHAAEHVFANDAIKAIETKVGKDGDTNTDSFDYKLQQITGINQAASIAYVNSKILGLLNDRGNYDASSNLFPATGGSGTAGAILKGDIWFISVSGTLGGIAVAVGDSVRALVDTPGQTATNWDILMVEGISVTSVTGLDTDNTNPRAPIVKIAVDPLSIGGDGTPGNPLFTIASGGSGSIFFFPTETVTKGKALACTQPLFAQASTFLDFGKATGAQKAAAMVFGSDKPMSSMKIALSGHTEIAFDATASGGPVNGTTLTWSHTCSGLNRLLLVTTSPTSSTITSVKYNGVALTLVPGSDHFWYMVNPPTGAHNVVITTGSSEHIAGVSSSYTGCDPTQFDSEHTSTSVAQVSTAATTVVGTGCWLVQGLLGNAPSFIASISSDKTDRGSVQNFGPGANISILLSDTNGTVPTGGGTAFTNSWTINGTQDTNSTVVSIKPLSGTSDNAVIRIETDNAGAPSGTLADANATGSVLGSSLTSTLADTTVTFAGAFTLTGGVKYWIVFTRSGSLSDGAFYDTGYVPSDARVFDVQNFDGASWTETAANSVLYANGEGFSWITKSDTSFPQSDNFVGFAESGVSPGTPVLTTSAGVTNSLSGLDTNVIYYLSTNGDLSESGTTKVGKAVQANKFLVVLPPL